MKVIPLVGRRANARSIGEVARPIGFQLINVLSHFDRFVENGSHGEVEEPHLSVILPDPYVAEESVALLFQVVQEALAFVIDPAADVGEAELSTPVLVVEVSKGRV